MILQTRKEPPLLAVWWNIMNIRNLIKNFDFSSVEDFKNELENNREAVLDWLKERAEGMTYKDEVLPKFYAEDCGELFKALQLNKGDKLIYGAGDTENAIVCDFEKYDFDKDGNLYLIANCENGGGIEAPAEMFSRHGSDIWAVYEDGELLVSILCDGSASLESVCEILDIEIAQTQEEFENVPENGMHYFEDLEMRLAPYFI